MEEISVPYIVHEGIMARQERIIRRLVIVLVITILLLFASNAAWIWAWNQYEYVSDSTVTVDGKDGVANYKGRAAEKSAVLFFEKFRKRALLLCKVGIYYNQSKGKGCRTPAEGEAPVGTSEDTRHPHRKEIQNEVEKRNSGLYVGSLL